MSAYRTLGRNREKILRVFALGQSATLRRDPITSQVGCLTFKSNRYLLGRWCDLARSLFSHHLKYMVPSVDRHSLGSCLKQDHPALLVFIILDWGSPAKKGGINPQLISLFSVIYFHTIFLGRGKFYFVLYTLISHTNITRFN